MSLYRKRRQCEGVSCPWLIEPMLERAGFRIEARYDLESRIYAAYTCVRV